MFSRFITWVLSHFKSQAGQIEPKIAAESVTEQPLVVQPPLPSKRKPKTTQPAATKPTEQKPSRRGRKPKKAQG